jgi:molybdate transport system substrate-binding protein
VITRSTVLIFCLLTGGKLTANEITVFAAASLSDSLKAIASEYTKSTGEKVIFNFAASNTLAQQISAGAPADIFFSADEAKMNALDKAGLILNKTRGDLLENSLVIIIPEGTTNINKPAELTNPRIKHLSIGDPLAVPAGIYAKLWLQKIGIWNSVQSKIIPAENVRAAMAVVESGNAEAGIVYKTDAAISKNIRVAFAIPINDGPQITYPAALLKDSKHINAAYKFLKFLEGKQAHAIFTKFGFSVCD